MAKNKIIEFETGNNGYKLIQKPTTDGNELFLYGYGAKEEPLRRLAEVLSTWVKKICPDLHTTIEITYEHDRHSFKLDLRKLLPPHISAIIGNHSLSRYYGNCHGTALFIAGILPVLTNLPNTTARQYIWKNCFTEITNRRKLEAGDIIQLTEADHSFVYLTSDWCISSNVNGPNIQFYSVKKVLEAHHCHEKLLPLDYSFTAYRNNYTITFNQTLLEDFSKLFTLNNDPVQCMLPTDPSYPSLKDIYRNLRARLNNQSENQDYWQYVLGIVTSRINFRIVKELQAEGNNQSLNATENQPTEPTINLSLQHTL